MKSNTTNDLGNDKIGPLLLKLAIPAITAQVINALYNIIDRMYIGHIENIGDIALTGVGVTMPIIMIISAFSALVGMGGSPRAAIEMGKNNNEGAEKILGNCFVVLITISLILTVVFFIFRNPLLLMFGASEQTVIYGSEYLSIYVIGTIFVQIALGLNSFITTQGFAKTSMLTVVIGALLNIILDPILIFVFNMGVKGAALATIISQAVSAIWVLKFLLGNKTKLKIKPKYFKIEKSVLLPVLALGLSPFVMQSTESLVSISLNSSLQRYGGDIAVGAMTIMTSVMQFVMLPLQGLTQSAQPIMSFNYGAKKVDRVKKTFKILIISALCYSFIAWLLVMLVPQVFASFFTPKPDLIKETVWGTRIYMGAIFMIGAQIACQQTFVSLGQAKISLFLALLRKIILLIPFIFIFPLFFKDKVFAVFFAEPVADFIATTTTITVFSIQIKKILNIEKIN